MGCSYYAELPDGARLHIGKSSGGWSFLLHVIPDRDLNSLADWRAFLERPDVEIFDCEDTFMDSAGLIDVITERADFVVGDLRRQRSSEWQFQNHAFFDERFKLARPVVGGSGGCIRNGDGPYDLIVGDFS